MGHGSLFRSHLYRWPPNLIRTSLEAGPRILLALWAVLAPFYINLYIPYFFELGNALLVFQFLSDKECFASLPPLSVSALVPVPAVTCRQ
jgi:hypothetical protein